MPGRAGKRVEKGSQRKFTFLGFTHLCGTNSRGNFVIWRQTERKRLEAKLQQVKQALKERCTILCRKRASARACAERVLPISRGAG